MTAPGLRRIALVTFGTTVLLFAANDLWQILIARELGESALSVSEQPSNYIGWLLLGIVDRPLHVGATTPCRPVDGIPRVQA